MARLDNWMKSEIKEIILYVFIGIICLMIPLLSGLIGKGFEESFVGGEPLTFGTYLTNFVIYNPFFLIGIFYIIFAITRMITIKRNEHPATQKPANWFRIFSVSYIFAPEENGALYWLSEKLGARGKKNIMRWSLKPLRVFVIAILIFGVYGLLTISYPQLAISGVPQLQLQQVTTFSEVTFGSLLPAFGENGLLLFIFSIFMGFVALFIGVKFKAGKEGFFGFGILICVLMGFIWGGLHSIVYGNSDASFWATVIFGFLGSLITLLTGIFIFWLVWHIMNNAFVILSKIVTYKEDIFLVVGLILGFLLIIWIIVEFLLAKKKKGGSEISIQGG